MEQTLERLGPGQLRAVAVGYRDALRAHREALNRLNVYPVPDGDTGTNMALTLDAVVAELGDGGDMAEVCRAITQGSLMGARGNSGVILSQLLRGLTDHLKGQPGADGPALADAMGHASRAAYQAVMRPVEGTILTVAREAAEAAGAAASSPGGSLTNVVEAAAEAGRAALERTPEQLAVLAEAGVVDAGGAGFVLLLDVLRNVVAGSPVPEPEVVPAAADRQAAAAIEACVAGDPRYEVMFLLDAPAEAVAPLKDAWAAIGDSIVVVGGDGTWNCHVHTDDIGAAVEAGVEVGRPHRIQVTDLHEQVEAERCRRDAAAGAGAERGAPTEAHDEEEAVLTAVVAVAAGEGVSRILRSLGARRVVEGGQSMNPSTAEILTAVEGAPGKEVVVLPDHKNVVAVAEQAAALAAKPARVVPTVDVGQGFAALMAYDPDADAETNAGAMARAASRAATGEVTQAVRDATTPAGRVAVGDWLAVTPHGVTAVAADPADAACRLLDQLVADGHEIVTVVTGQGATEEHTRRITEWLRENRPDAELEVHEGGQPLAAYLISCE
jgi:DAK2 domain fusion protein YloV